jgi:stage III sporulation protein AG
MSQILKNIRKLSVPKRFIPIVLAVVALLFLILSEFVSTDKSETTDAHNTSAYAAQYTKEIEKELESILCKIHGAGDVRAMVTLESCYENVYAKGYSTKNEQEEHKDSTEMTEEYIIIKNGSNNEECLVVKVYEPTVKGVAIVAEGADDVNVKAAITETVCALFGISSAKVSVEKMTAK